MAASPFDKVGSLRKEYRFLVGVDEAGWGPLAGPFSCAAVAFDPGTTIPKFIKDSKKLSEARREEAYKWILDNSSYLNYFMSSMCDFDLGAGMVREIYFKSLIADANKNFPHDSVVVIDGSYKPRVSETVETMVKGDMLCPEISAASIVAKVVRDRFMNNIHEEYPCFDWVTNKGYATKKHLEAIDKYGVTKYHRQNIRRIKDAKAYEALRED